MTAEKSRSGNMAAQRLRNIVSWSDAGAGLEQVMRGPSMRKSFGDVSTDGAAWFAETVACSPFSCGTMFSSSIGTSSLSLVGVVYSSSGFLIAKVLSKAGVVGAGDS